jgi:hypothetical protein
VPQEAQRYAPLSVHCAFVVHFRLSTNLAQGRVEHVVSSQSTHFDSLEELLAFIGQVLAKVRGPPCRRS